MIMGMTAEIQALKDGMGEVDRELCYGMCASLRLFLLRCCRILTFIIPVLELKR